MSINNATYTCAISACRGGTARWGNLKQIAMDLAIDYQMSAHIYTQQEWTTLRPDDITYIQCDCEKCCEHGTASFVKAYARGAASALTPNVFGTYFWLGYPPFK